MGRGPATCAGTRLFWIIAGVSNLDFWSANNTVATEPATTVMSPPSSLIEKGSIPDSLMFVERRGYSGGDPDNGHKALCPLSLQYVEPGSVILAPHSSTVRSPDDHAVRGVRRTH